ncbi:MAG: LytR C-terminal domain-containing protein [Actinomycetota bacterium]|nr:LytR C-terminal domain-containing protein [Actinomycetota bacterium]
MATAVLRAGLVVAALALGLFVLSKAFPSGDEEAATVPPGGTETASPVGPSPTAPATSPTGGGGGGGGTTEEPRDPSEVELQVLNGTDVAGLADETRQVLEEEGYRVLTIGNAQGGPYETTQITHQKKARADAEALAERFFPGAQLETATPDTQVDITVILGDDYAAAQDEAPEESPS